MLLELQETFVLYRVTASNTDYEPSIDSNLGKYGGVAVAVAAVTTAKELCRAAQPCLHAAALPIFRRIIRT
jgi:hypothetical protein